MAAPETHVTTRKVYIKTSKRMLLSISTRSMREFMAISRLEGERIIHTIHYPFEFKLSGWHDMSTTEYIYLSRNFETAKNIFE